MKSDKARLRAAYHESLQAHWVRLGAIAASVGLALIPAGVFLDAELYPQRMAAFARLRLLVDMAVAATLAACFTAAGRRLVRPLTYGWLLLVQAMICYMIWATDGAGSTYYAGLTLAVLTLGIVLPASLAEAVGFCSATAALYAAAVVLHPGGLDRAALFNNAYFLLLTCLITVLATWINARGRFSEFRLSYQLDERNRELADLARMKSRFLANISHELRTPLTLILAPLEDLLAAPARLPAGLAGTLTTARDNALRLLRLVNDLLEVIRLEEGGAAPEMRPLRLHPLLRGLADAVAPLARARGLSLATRLSAEELVVVADHDALERIVLNLLGNAVKFTDAGGRIELRTARRGDQVLIEVADTGIGISESALPYVFDRFRQADGSSTRRYRGTGLGLALVKELAERHGGTVEAHSRLGRGTTMTVRLPAADAEQAARAADAPPVDLHRAAWRPASRPVEPVVADPTDPRPRLLLVDDEPDMRGYLAELLGAEFQVHQAADGRVALELARRLTPELMVLDLMLPELDGLAVCRELKRDPATRAVKLVLLTARVDEAAKLEALTSGADDFLTKPFSSIEVKTRLRNLLVTASLERDLRARNEELESALARLRRTQDQLVQSEKLNALGSLTAGLLHEVNNPLNYCLTALRLARREAAGLAELEEMLADVDEGMQRIRAIVADLRAFAHPGRGELRPFELREAVASAIQFTAHEHRDIVVENATCAGVQVLGSRTHVVQVLVNLLSNAGRAVAAGSGRIVVDGRIRGGRYEVRVRDNGAGMDAETLRRVFDPFFTTREVGQGMGLGLSICHTIIGNHGGRLSGESEPGRGSEFRFDLPLAPLEEPA